MRVLALGSVAWIASAIVLLFGSLVILSYTLTLVRRTKDLASGIARAREQLVREMADVGEGAREARERLERIDERRRARRARRPR